MGEVRQDLAILAIAALSRDVCRQTDLTNNGKNGQV
jgi:hypothetical protein